MQRNKYFLCATLIALVVTLSGEAEAQKRPLIWSDEFNGPVNGEPDPAKWDYDIGGWGWGNNELEYYTSRRENSYLDGEGHLIIKAIREKYTGQDGVTRDYTSARLVTRGKFERAYGYFETRLKLPSGQGMWPAFWMLGNDINQPGVGWPKCGEIDIMENIGREPSINHGSLHGPGYSGGNPLTGSLTLANNQRFADDYHVFAIEWNTRAISFYVDGVLYQTRTQADVPAGAAWVYHHPFYMLLNLAVGGDWPGSPDGTTILPQTMTIDYVRVYADERTGPATNRRTPKRVVDP